MSFLNWLTVMTVLFQKQPSLLQFAVHYDFRLAKTRFVEA
jgi:hypothetical protein